MAIETGDGEDQPVVYMSAEEGKLVPELAPSFIEFLERWTSFCLIDLEVYCAKTPCLDAQGFGSDAPSLVEWRSWWGRI